ncbi:MAG: prephenate dehydratase [Desulfovibrio sp.]|nr:prephenate dehydratase [Desulfovibrio sp.]
MAAETSAKPETPAKAKTAAPAAPPASGITPEDLEGFLSGVRRDIDAIDDAILDLLNRRAAASIEVGRRKSGTSQAVFKPFREKEVLKRLAAKNAGPLPTEHLRVIYREILSSSRRLQRPEKVVYLGPEGTFSHFAAMAALGRAGEFEPKPSIDDVFAAVAAREADLGLVPLENSLQGTVGQSLDLFMRHDVFVQAEVYCKISHALLSKATDLAHVKTVYSHPQPLAQCAGWLRAHLPKARIIPTESTAAAALRILKTPSAAAIGHRRLGEMHNLNVLAARIEDLPDNWTRFLIIGPADTKQENRDKTSILFNLPDKPGSLHSVLAKLAGRDINMTKLESRPFRGEKWKYVFFADLQCDLSRAEYAKLLDELRACTHSLRILGCYPAGPHIDVSGGTEVIEE